MSKYSPKTMLRATIADKINEYHLRCARRVTKMRCRRCVLVTLCENASLSVRLPASRARKRGSLRHFLREAFRERPLPEHLYRKTTLRGQTAQFFARANPRRKSKTSAAPSLLGYSIPALAEKTEHVQEEIDEIQIELVRRERVHIERVLEL